MALLVIITLALYGLMYVIHQKVDAFKEYEFNNRDSGGSVGFDSYKEAKRFRNSQHRWTYLFNLVSVIAAFSTLVTVMAYVINK